MKSNIFMFFCTLVIVSNVNAFFVNDQDKQKISQDLLEAFRHSLDEMRKCLDQLTAEVVDKVDTKSLQPAFDMVGDNLNRITKAVNDLTAPKTKKRSY